MDQCTPLIGCEAMDFRYIDEGFEYLEENVIRKGSDCHPLVKLAYTAHNQ